MSCWTPEFRSNVAILGLLGGLLVTSAVPIALLSAITALIPVFVCRNEVTWPIACCGFEAALGVDSVSSVQAGPLDGAFPVLHCWPTPSACAIPLQRSSRFWPDWWMMHRTLVAPSFLKASPDAWPASCSG